MILIEYSIIKMSNDRIKLTSLKLLFCDNISNNDVKNLINLTYLDINHNDISYLDQLNYN